MEAIKNFVDLREKINKYSGIKFTGEGDYIEEYNKKFIKESEWADIVLKIEKGESFDSMIFDTNRESFFDTSGYAGNSHIKSYIIIHDVDYLESKYLIEFYGAEEYQDYICNETFTLYRESLKEVAFVSIQS